MPTDTKNVITNIPCSITKWGAGGYATTNSNKQSILDYDSRTYVQARSRPKGFVNPKPFSRYLTTGTQYYMKAYMYLVSASSPLVSNTQNYHNALIGFATAPSFDGTLSSRALLDARLKVKEQSVNFAVALAESGRTAKLLGDSAKRISATGFTMGNAFVDYRNTGLKVANTATKLARAAMAVKSGQFQKAAGLLGIKRPGNLPRVMKKTRLAAKHVGQNWLEFQYGWKPLMSDMFGAVEHLAKRNNESPTRFGCTVKSRKSSMGTIYKYSLQSTDCGSSVLNSANVKWEQSCFVRMDYRQKHADMAELARTGATNPLEVAWELVPFSFVVDWFAPIGKFLSALDAESGWEFISGSKTTRLVNLHTLSISPNQRSFDKVSIASGLCKLRRKEVNRTVLSSSPIPPFFFKNPVSPVHLANATALIATAFGSRYK